MTLRSLDAAALLEDAEVARLLWYVEFVPPPAKRASAAKVTRRRELTDLRRAEIIAAALTVFATKGFSSARAEDVAAQANIAKGTLYLYFDSKEAIYEAALAHAMEQLHVLVEARLKGAATAEERIRVYVDERLRFWGARGELYSMIMTVGREKGQKKRTAQILKDSVEFLLEILHAGIASGELREKPVEPLGWAIMDIIRGSSERRVDGLQATSYEEDSALITAMAVRYFNS